MFLLFSSCVQEKEDLNLNLESDFFRKVNRIIDDPSIYALLTPKSINPFDFDLKVPDLNKEEAKIQDLSIEAKVIPDELALANSDYQKTVRILIKKRSELSFEDFNKLAYSIEQEVINSPLSNIKKDFLFTELATLKALNAFKNLYSLNNRILCDSQWECDILGCMTEKMEEQFGPDVNWIDLIHNTYSLPLSFPVAWLSCTYDATFDDE